ncbi:MAG: ATPase inhibitor subunit zeta, partial [Pseudomonadota bacterium]
GYEGEKAEEYAKEVVRADFEEPGDEDVFRKIRADFDASSIDQSDHQIRRNMDELMSTAIEQLQNEG